tara:strand:+ start:586 stop:939 length:354 start_codon:yes stop_codon:yes gene_type:complete
MDIGDSSQLLILIPIVYILWWLREKWKTSNKSNPHEEEILNEKRNEWIKIRKKKDAEYNAKHYPAENKKEEEKGWTLFSLSCLFLSIWMFFLFIFNIDILEIIFKIITGVIKGVTQP